MTDPQLQTEALGQLGSGHRLILLDSIDRLRSEGVDHYVSLPQIIVCGDQSAGKSSVLEAISRVSFPVQSGTCTRFPTELILRRAPQVGSSVSIVPHASRSEAEVQLLRGFRKDLEGFEGLGALIEDAKGIMGVYRDKTFSGDLLRIEIRGPERPHLTIVDLPGLIHSPTGNQTDEDAESIRRIVKEYMEEPRSVILAVISASNDLQNQIVLKMVRNIDPSGQRTMGIITKPDSLISASPKLNRFFSLAQNKEPGLEWRLGWHVLKNMDSEKGTYSIAKRDLEENEFFSRGGWENLPTDLLGASNLRRRLSDVLTRQIASELPSLVKEIASKVRDCQECLEKMGQRRATKHEQHLYLIKISTMFQTLTKASVDGAYTDLFFEDPQSERGYSQRLRAVIHNHNRRFARELNTRGHHRQIVQAPPEKSPDRKKGQCVQITRDDFIAHIQNLISRTRGRELPGTFSPMIVADLFRDQCRPWGAILEDHVERVIAAAKELLTAVCTHIAVDTCSRLLILHVVNPAVARLSEALRSKADELLRPHKSCHPITYTDSFPETLHKVRDDRRMAEIVQGFDSWLEEMTNAGKGVCTLSRTDKLLALKKILARGREPDMDRIAASDALDCMEAYYEVAKKRFLDDVAVQLVEEKLLSALADVFTPTTVFTMAPDMIARIAGESADDVQRREQLDRRLQVLGTCSDFCKRFVDIKPSTLWSMDKQPALMTPLESTTTSETGHEGDTEEEGETGHEGDTEDKGEKDDGSLN